MLQSQVTQSDSKKSPKKACIKLTHTHLLIFTPRSLLEFLWKSKWDVRSTTWCAPTRRDSLPWTGLRWWFGTGPSLKATQSSSASPSRTIQVSLAARWTLWRILQSTSETLTQDTSSSKLSTQPTTGLSGKLKFSDLFTEKKRKR